MAWVGWPRCRHAPLLRLVCRDATDRATDSATDGATDGATDSATDSCAYFGSKPRQAQARAGDRGLRRCLAAWVPSRAATGR